MTEERNNRKVRQGVVVSAAGDKTCTVQVKDRKPHPVYKKMMTTTKKFYVHDEENTAGAGQPIRVRETRHLPTTHPGRPGDIVERAK